ncbi:MAG: type II CAAX prenyl endopeptidase Rce1 family protein, partial [Lachnospiraceae bacterium]
SVFCGENRALLFSALAFGLFHGNLTQGIAAALLALILGWIYLKTDALLLTICMHGTGNMLILLLVQTERGQKLAASPGLWAVALGFFLLAVCYLRRRAAARISA